MNKHSIKITSIRCLGTSESNITGGDELYLVCQADAGIPVHMPFGNQEGKQMKSGDTWELEDDEGILLNFEYELLVSLWDYDFNDTLNNSTFLQCYNFDLRTPSGTFYKELENYNGAHYKIYFTKGD